ncbi:hypothetical protein M2133_001091 [Parabacteroides sp. PF5-6]|nr:hypothetical protein [Parabacteroides sp. PF5-6]
MCYDIYAFQIYSLKKKSTICFRIDCLTYLFHYFFHEVTEFVVKLKWVN